MFREKWIVASSRQDAVLIDLAVRAKPDAEVVFLDTGYHFAETLGVRDALPLTYRDLRILNVTPDRSVVEQNVFEGVDLFRSDPNRCCLLRKVLPLRRALSGYDAWVTGVRRVDSSARHDFPVVSWDARNGLVKVNPLAAWDDARFNSYIVDNGILQNLLVQEGYLSIGCAPCTVKPLIDGDARSGRWAETGKSECGLHG
ncbi:phosphoadenosine phosphosulfate reductase [Streptomyces sp. V4I8]